VSDSSYATSIVVVLRAALGPVGFRSRLTPGSPCLTRVSPTTSHRLTEVIDMAIICSPRVPASGFEDARKRT